MMYPKPFSQDEAAAIHLTRLSQVLHVNSGKVFFSSVTPGTVLSLSFPTSKQGYNPVPGNVEMTLPKSS